MSFVLGGGIVEYFWDLQKTLPCQYLTAYLRKVRALDENIRNDIRYSVIQDLVRQSPII